MKKCVVLPVDADAIARAASILRAGGLVAFPTETVYGLGANAQDTNAVAKIFAAKGRPASNPLIVHVADITEAKQLVSAWPAIANTLAQRFWPGPLTLVLPRAVQVPDSVTAGGPTIAIRIPAHPVALALLHACRLPLAAPSANRSTQLSPTTAQHVMRGLSDSIDLLLDAGPTTGGLESTVLDVTTDPPRLLRPGLITVAQIEAAIGPITYQANADAAEVARSPGQMARHYAPRTPLQIASDSHVLVEALNTKGSRLGWVTYLPSPLPLYSGGEGPGVRGLVSPIIHDVQPNDAIPPHPNPLPPSTGGEGAPQVWRILLPADPLSYAARLYAALHQLDAAGLDRIIVETPPTGDDWLAIHDRLQRASEPHSG
jgi:L-threonylcarbamoyladenylate synthase